MAPDPYFEQMGFGLSRRPDCTCLKCGAIVRSDLQELHRRSHRSWWKRFWDWGMG